MSFTYKDAEIDIERNYDRDEEVRYSVVIWFVRGSTDTHIGYPTKIIAEAAARQLHPGKDTNSMVYYQVFIKDY